MEIAHILYIVISMNGTGSVALTSMHSEHGSKSTCETAAIVVRQSISDGKIILAKCTPK